MRAEKTPLTVQPEGFVSGYLMVALETVAALPVIWERFGLRDFADARNFIRLWSWHTEDDQSPLRPFIVVMLSTQDWTTTAVATGGTFLPSSTVWVYLTDRARAPDQNGYLDWCNFVGKVIQGIIDRQADLMACRISSIGIESLRRTDPDMDGSEAGHEGTPSKLEAFWETKLAINYTQNG